MVPYTSTGSPTMLKKLGTLLLAVLFTSLLLLRVRGEPRVGEVDPQCKRERRNITVRWPDCESTQVKVPTCSGTCTSYDVVTTRAPYLLKQCSCCKSRQHSVRRRQLTFNCNGEMKKHTVFIPIIDSCVCVRCQVS